MPRAVPALLAPLQHADFRRLWLGTMISHAGDWMDTVALSWLVLAVAGTPVALGWLALARGGPILLFTLVGGAVADRVDRRRLVVATQVAGLVLALLLGSLAVAGWTPLWLVLAVAAGRGVAMSFNIPARQSLVPALVPREVLAPAIALNSATFNTMRAFGPAAGGLLVAAAGPGVAFLANAASYVPAIVATLAITTSGRVAAGTVPGRSLAAEITQGLVHVARTPALRAPLALVILPMVLGQPYISLLAVFARDVLAAGPAGYGFLVAASALGSIVGALYVGHRADAPRDLWQVRAILLHAVSLVLFAASGVYALSLVLVVLVGATSTAAIAIAVTRLQESADDAMRGRVMSVFFLNRGLVPLGTMVGAAGAAAVGAPLALAAMAALMGALVLPVRRAAGSGVRDEGEDGHQEGGGEDQSGRKVAVEDRLEHPGEEAAVVDGLAGQAAEVVLDVGERADPTEGGHGHRVGQRGQVGPAQPRPAPGDEGAEGDEDEERGVRHERQVGEGRVERRHREGS
ncbi:MAG TPA: MFS transporter [Thermodesulfobacteriota bacterium]